MGFWDHLLEANKHGARSTTLAPLHAPFGLLVAGLVYAATREHTPGWVLIALFATAGVFAALYLVAYSYFMVKDPDSLRSERYSLRKLEISKGLIGDSETGMHEASIEARIVSVETPKQLTEAETDEDDDAS